jgi:DNA-binding response OmpR family regulator
MTSEPTASDLSGRLRGRRILLVDDDPDILAGMEIAFRAEGAETLRAVDGEAALAAIRSSAPDLVVLDMMLPRASGLLVLEKLRQAPSAPPIVMITANRGRRHQQFAESLGVEAYLVKPVPLQRLLEVAAAWLGPDAPAPPVDEADS